MQWSIWGKNIHYYNNVFRFGVANKIASVTNLRSLKWSYSCSIICVGSPSSSPVFWDAKTSAVKGHAPYSPTAATSAAQSSLTSNKITTGNCSLVTRVCWPSPGNAMCYLNLKWSEYLLWLKIYKAVYHDYGQWFISFIISYIAVKKIHVDKLDSQVRQLQLSLLQSLPKLS